MSARDDPLLHPDPAPAEPEAVGLTDDALAQALVWLTRYHGNERSIASLFEDRKSVV